MIGKLAMEVRGALDRNNSAQRVGRLVAVSEELLATVSSFRRERGTILAALAAEGTADASADKRAASNREVSEAAYQRVQDLFAGSSEPGLTARMSAVLAAHATLATLRSKADVAIHQPKSSREMAFAQQFPQMTQAYLDTLIQLTDEIEGSIRLIDPVLDYLLGMKRSAWAARDAAGQVIIRMGAAASSEKPWTVTEIVGAAEDVGRADRAWNDVLEAASRSDAPPAIVDSIARWKRPDAIAMAEQHKDYINSLNNGQPIKVKYADLAKLESALQDLRSDVTTVALAEMVSRAERQMSLARWGLVADAGMMLLAVAVAAFGFALVQFRVTGPLRNLALAMRGLAKRDYGVQLAAWIEATRLAR
ncbi:hypothetical protein [Bradyrhizobium neotropicale]|uniref:hypothetical protein n=1 Tax=Bradyrhizobium neotropicale TaxID=1497615 RepID=UPI000A59F174|nr:hypothetical protein [Bradyrhizobium neotropicale]